ncbi:uncharacterized protein K444DRAFT_28591 [Hyaloscypha bicolor E]|uniref:Uncharacterized protein n=1 Tax=Hyaloscypha bicolor E TaxID=1095630 RepID=A0A2J6T391_9HELO|nr:uncharacterized protein K444DRAFT_28591 [Hyaloscypha bicolor E]PMD57498.1 hypothetical protein K444DRAFT_28591 [Hyaloscypha bicolor E]
MSVSSPDTQHENRYPVTWGIGYGAIMLLKSFLTGIRSLLCLSAVFARFTPLRMAAYDFTLCFLSGSRLWHHWCKIQGTHFTLRCQYPQKPPFFRNTYRYTFYLIKSFIFESGKEALSRALVQTPPDRHL